jgi:hypothetical protein
MVAHVKVLATAAILFLFLGFIDSIPDVPGVFREQGLKSAQVLQGPVAPDQPADIVTARLIVDGSAAARAIPDWETPAAILLYCNDNALLSVAADSSPPVS